MSIPERIASTWTIEEQKYEVSRQWSRMSLMLTGKLKAFDCYSLKSAFVGRSSSRTIETWHHVFSKQSYISAVQVSQISWVHPAYVETQHGFSNMLFIDSLSVAETAALCDSGSPRIHLCFYDTQPSGDPTTRKDSLSYFKCNFARYRGLPVCHFDWWGWSRRIPRFNKSFRSFCIQTPTHEDTCAIST